MTEQERAFEAWNEEYVDSRDFSSTKEGRKAAFLAGWKRERVKANPFTYELVVPTPGEMHLGDWVERNKIPAGTKLRVTVEEV